MTSSEVAVSIFTESEAVAHSDSGNHMDCDFRFWIFVTGSVLKIGNHTLTSSNRQRLDIHSQSIISYNCF